MVAVLDPAKLVDQAVNEIGLGTKICLIVRDFSITINVIDLGGPGNEIWLICHAVGRMKQLENGHVGVVGHVKRGSSGTNVDDIRANSGFGNIESIGCCFTAGQVAAGEVHSQSGCHELGIDFGWPGGLFGFLFKQLIFVECCYFWAVAKSISEYVAEVGRHAFLV